MLSIIAGNYREKVVYNKFYAIMELAKLISTNEIELIFCPDGHSKKIAEYKKDGYSEFVPGKQPQAEQGCVAVDSFKIKKGKVVQSWEVIRDLVYAKKQIDELKAQLAATDYKVIKCMEATLIGEQLPYDLTVVHTQRQAIRDRLQLLL